MVSTATIKVKRGRSSEGESGQNVDKAMLKELKNINNIFSRASKLTQSGFMGGGIGSIISSVLGGAKSGGGSLLGGLSTINTIGQGANALDKFQDASSAFKNLKGGGFTGTESFQLDEEGNVQRINIVTGEILETIDKQEAIERDILDNRGELRDIYKTINKSADAANKLFELLPESVQKMLNGIRGVENNLNSFADAVKEAERKMRNKAKMKVKQDFGVDVDLEIGPNATSPFINDRNDAVNFTKEASSSALVRFK